jgi:hypothetical protein
MILMRNTGVSPPSLTTRSLGTKIVLFPVLSATNADYAFGIESSALWQSVPNTVNQFKWYAGITPIMTLSGTGIRTLPSQPSFSSGMTSNYTPPSGGPTSTTAVQFNTVSGTGCFQNGSGFNTGTYKFACPVAGIYEFKVRLLINTLSTTTSIIVFTNSSVAANNNIRLNQYDFAGNFVARQQSTVGTVLLNCAAGEQIGVNVFYGVSPSGSVYPTIVGSDSIEFTNFSGHLLS